MLVPLSWLQEYVDLIVPTGQLAERLTLAGLEVEGIKHIGDWWDAEKIVVGQVVAVKAHPNADKLVLVDVDCGKAEQEQVVTSARNLFAYKDVEKLPVLKVAFARAGAVLIDAHSEEQPRPKKKLQSSEIRGIPSNGMVCSERELGLGEEHEGIFLLAEDAPVGKPLRDYYADEVLELGLTPDMARCLSIIGVAREVAALTDAPLHLPPDDLPSSNGRIASDYVDVEIADPTLCNRYTGMIIQDVQVGESPKWMQDRLRRTGIRPINNIVDITNYVMLEWGQPLHAFDYDLLAKRAEKTGRAKPTIIVRRAQLGEKMTTLDGIRRELDESMLLITDTVGPIAIAGVMGGAETEVHAETRTILLESATFDGINNRRTSQKLKLHTEASHRFTRGVPATLNAIAARRAARFIHEYAQGRVASGMVDNYPLPQVQRVIYTTESEIRRQLGMNIDLPTIAASLRKLDIAVERYTSLDTSLSSLGDALFGLQIEPREPLLRCIAPWHRLDLHIPADLTEEVARVIGYEHIETTLIDDVLPPQHRKLVLETEEKMRDILVGCGLQETISYSLTTPEQQDKIDRAQPGTAEQSNPFISLANPLSAKRRMMRRSMLVSALENWTYNCRFAQRFAIFEIGRVYLPEKGDGVRPYEDRRLSVLLTGPRRPSSVYPDPAGAEPFDFFDLKGVLETLLDHLGLNTEEIEFVAQPDHPPFGRNCAQLKINGIVEGILGELHPQVQGAFNLPSAPVYVAEIRVAPLVKPSWRLDTMKPISNYPSVVEDLAFVVPEGVTASQVIGTIRDAGGHLLTGVELFDIYRGPSIPAEHKSLAYKLTYESTEKTLSESEVVAIRERVIRHVAESVGGVLRA